MLALRRDVLEEIYVSLGSDAERVRRFYEMFIDGIVRLIEELRQQQSLAASSRTLHSLKGSAAMAGANRLRALAIRLRETSAKDEPVASAIRELEQELATFRSALESELAAMCSSNPSRLDSD